MHPYATKTNLIYATLSKTMGYNYPITQLFSCINYNHRSSYYSNFMKKGTSANLANVVIDMPVYRVYCNS